MKNLVAVVIFAILALIVFALPSCKGKKYVTGKYVQVTEIPDGKALVYIYRPSRFLGGGNHYTINDGNDKVSRIHLYNGGYFEYFTDPGKHNFWLELSGKREDIIVNCEEGETYFVKVNVVEFFLVPNEIGQMEIRKCNKLLIE